MLSHCESSLLTSYSKNIVSILSSSFVVSVGDNSGLSASVDEAGGFSGAVVRLVSSYSPWAKRQRSPYLQLPFSLQFLHISYFNRFTTFELPVEAVVFFSSTWAFEAESC